MSKFLAGSLLALLAVPLVGCGPPLYWVRPNTTPEQAALDRDQCGLLAWREARYENFFYPGPFYPYSAFDRFGRPYYFRPSPFGYDNTFYREHQLLDFCMRARGYALTTLQPAAQPPLAPQPQYAPPPQYTPSPQYLPAPPMGQSPPVPPPTYQPSDPPTSAPQAQ